MDRIAFGGKLKRILMVPARMVTAFWEHAMAKGSRSTILQPVSAILAICIAGVLGGVYVKAPEWFIVMLAVIAGLSALLFLFTYAYCMFSKSGDNSLRELLRSETHSIQKLAIEKGFVGDSMAGIFRPEIESGDPHDGPAGLIGK
jgi:hypothetical protein